MAPSTLLRVEKAVIQRTCRSSSRSKKADIKRGVFSTHSFKTWFTEIDSFRHDKSQGQGAHEGRSRVVRTRKKTGEGGVACPRPEVRFHAELKDASYHGKKVMPALLKNELHPSFWGGGRRPRRPRSRTNVVLGREERRRRPP